MAPRLINADGVFSPLLRRTIFPFAASHHCPVAVRSHHRPVQPLARPHMRFGTVALPCQQARRGIVLVTRLWRGAAYLFGRLLAFPSRTPFAGVLLRYIFGKVYGFRELPPCFEQQANAMRRTNDSA